LSDATGLKFVPVIVSVEPTGPLGGLKPVIVGLGTVKLDPLCPTWPPTVTLIFPVVAAEGTLAISWVAEADVGVVVVPLKLTVLLAGFAEKLVPVIVTGVPYTPLDGLNPVTVGGVVTVKLPLLVPVRAPTVTEIGPEVAPVGTGTTSWLAVAVVGCAAVTPLNLMTSFALVVLKLVPVIVTLVVAGPLDGLNPVTVGGLTVYVPELVPVPFEATVTEIVPLVAFNGTATTSCVAVAVVGVPAVTPLNLMTLFAFVVLKFVPVIVTVVVNTGPVVGENPVTVGAAAKQVGSDRQQSSPAPRLVRTIMTPVRQADANIDIDISPHAMTRPKAKSRVR
jgi:hypothetical protein